MNKRFKLAFEDFDGWAILDTTGEYSDDEDYIDWLSGQKAVDVLNHFAEENEQLKQQVAFLEEFLKTGVQYEYYQKVYDENEGLKQSIKEIDEAELHLKQIILKRIDDYIWEWEDEGTPVAQVLRELRDEIKGDVE